MEFIWFLLIGATAGFLAGMIMKGGGFGLLGNLVLGILGAIFGGWLFGALGIYPDGGLIASLVTALVGAIVLIAIVRVFKRA
ncbi:MAG: GlsB/YeaQ/YmgE family stress response membrane protein [Planctomycetes bacterium]|nr:GlsB/YeaQ/YmgE family stress response membrane protein [Planctomycetota bacterium]